MSTASDTALLTPPAWSVRLAVDPEYASLRHVGSLEFARLFQEARVRFNDHLIAQMRGPQHFSDQMIVHISMDFGAEVFWTPELDIHVRAGRIGRTSYETDVSVWNGDVLAVRSNTVNVWVDGSDPVAITDEARALLQSTQ